MLKGYFTCLLLILSWGYVISVCVFHNDKLGEFLIIQLQIVFAFVWLPVLFFDPEVTESTSTTGKEGKTNTIPNPSNKWHIKRKK